MNIIRENSPVEFVRRNIREIGYLERKEQRQTQLNSRRGTLGDVNCNRRLTTSEVKILAERLKRRSQFKVHDYSILSQALMQSEENIIAFFKATGALQALIGDLTGQDAARQLAAATCCCNLALGNEKSCLQLANAAGFYLISYLNGLNNHLLEICTWTLGNLAGSGFKTWKVLHAQGVLYTLLHLVETSTSDVVRSVIYALNHFVRIGLTSSNLDSASITDIARQVHPLMETEPSTCWMIYLLSCCADCDDILLSNSIVNRVVCILYQSETDHSNDSEITKITALVRILGNLCATDQGARELLCTEPTVLFSILHKLLTYSYVHIQRETLWLVANLLNNSSADVQLLVRTRNFEASLEPLLSETVSKVL